MSASLERSSPLASRRSTLPRPIRGVGLSIESWAQSCASYEPVAVTASGPMWALQCEFPAVTWALMGLPPGDR